MSLNRIKHKWMTWIALAGLVFAQLAVSAYACPLDVSRSAAQMTQAFADHTALPCADSTLPDAALCHEHCKQGNLISTDAQPPAFTIVPAFVVTVPVIFEMPSISAPPVPELAHPISPPLSIRNCCFRI